MLKKILFLLFVGLTLADRRKRFLFDTNQNPFPNSPFGGGGSGGVSSPFGSGSGSGGMSSPFGTGGTSGSYSPCVPTHAMCSLQCANGYVKGPGGCDFCMCNSQTGTTSGSFLIDPIDATGTTTPASTTQAPIVITQDPVASSNTTAAACIAAKLNCASACGEKGYLVDPSDCTFCLCKNSMMN